MDNFALKYFRKNTNSFSLAIVDASILGDALIYIHPEKLENINEKEQTIMLPEGFFQKSVTPLQPNGKSMYGVAPFYKLQPPFKTNNK